MSEPKIIILSGPSGVGKGTVRGLLDFDDLNLVNSVSWTTRDPRPGEVEGVSYHFVTPEEFEKNVAENGFVEHAGFTNNAYGTPRKPIEDWMAEGKNVLLEIEVNGAMQVMEKYPDAVSIFLVPPTVDDLGKRLTGRNTEDEEKIKKRLARSVEEMKYKDKYQHVVVNDVAQRAAKEVADIIKGNVDSDN